MKLFEVWPFKAVYWELTCILKADWYIIPPVVEGDYVREILRHPGHTQLIEKYTTNVLPLERVPFSDYDLVITLDPILKPPPDSRTLFAYYVQEHWDRLYRESLRSPCPGYELFLDHMMEAPAHTEHLPQALSFPYLHDPHFLRSQFSPSRQELAWADHRLLMTLAGKRPGEVASAEAAAAKTRLEQVLDIEIRCTTINQTNPWGVYDPPHWGEPAEYLRELASCRYYLAVGDMAGAGQGLVEAAALGCLCIGQADRAYHRLLCHPTCLCEDLAEMPRRFRALRNNPDLCRDVLAFQDTNLTEHFLNRPLRALASAIEMKRKQ